MHRIKNASTIFCGCCMFEPPSTFLIFARPFVTDVSTATYTPWSVCLLVNIIGYVLVNTRMNGTGTQQTIIDVERLTNSSVDRLLSVCAQTVDRYIGQRMFLCSICALEPFFHKHLTNISVDRLPSICAETVDRNIGTKKKRKSMKIKKITL